MERKQMTFYVSFWDAINALPKKDQLPVIRATISYGLFGSHEEALSISQKAFFSLIKPTLDASRKKASIGKQGGSKPKANGKQTASKAEANRKQSGSEGEGEKEVEGEEEVEGEKEVEVEVEKENECYISFSATAPKDGGAAPGKLFDAFWEKYPHKVGREECMAVWPEADHSQVMAGLDRWITSVEWAKEDGRFIPRPEKWLKEKRYLAQPLQAIPKGASGKLGTAEIEALEKLLGED